MKNLLYALLFASLNSFAGGSSVIHAEFTLYPDGPLNHNWPWCGWGPDVPFNQGDGTHGVQCVSVPGVIIAIVGTSTVKTPGNEVLASIYCNGKSLWHGEHFQGTIPISVSGLEAAGLTGPCYIATQNLGPFSPSGYEIQLTIFYK